MLMRNLGRTGLKVSAFCLGTNTFGRMTDQAASDAVLDAFVEGGGNFIDTADVYGRGDSETILGNWLKARGKREAAIVATKVGLPMGEGPNEKGLSRQRIMAGVEASLRRLQTDYIDVYQAHRDDRETPLDETLRGFDDLVGQGKVRYVACSNYVSWRLAEALAESEHRGWARYESLQPRYNLYYRDEYERELEPLCQERRVGVITYSSLGSGFFSGKYRPGQPLPATPRASGVERDYFNERGWRILEAVERVAKARGATPAQVALAWIVQRPGITAPIASATSPEQLRELLGSVEPNLDAEALAQLDQASAWK
ncbi:MAG TPA: aldo/keto reductase [Chloroflexota bacterium]|jgi:aryl-alcohol dehydrogenase-like predicted oxidoreductase